MGAYQIKKLGMALAGAMALAMAPAANAAVYISFAGGTGVVAAGQTLITDFSSPYAGLTGGIITNNQPWAAVPAFTMTPNKFLAVVGGAMADLSFAATNVLSFDLGSSDVYNSFQLVFADGTMSQVYNGNDLTSPANGNQGSALTNGRVTIKSNQQITGIHLASASNSLEVDDFASRLAGGIPEPATWALMMLGVGGIGASLRTRRRRVLAAA